jgi:hypothetical protein
LRIVAAVAFLSRAFLASPRCMHDIKTWYAKHHQSILL